MSSFAIIDCNSFYASCEKVFRPQLRDEPVVVLSNNDGCIIARSKEAKALGVEMGGPYFKIKNELRKLGVHVFSSNYALYGDMSHRVMDVLGKFSPDIEIYSIDEAFLDLSGLPHGRLTEYGREIRRTVKKWTGLPVSVGIAETKTLAKIANRIAKKSEKTDGVLNLVDSPYVEKALEITPITDIWGVGRRWGKRLGKYGIDNALELRNADEGWIRSQFSVVLQRTVLELRGLPCIPLDASPAARQGIISSRSFGNPVTLLSELREAVAAYMTRAAEKLREQGLAANILIVFIKTNRFKEDEPQYSGKAVVELPIATDNTRDLVRYAHDALEGIFKDGYPYKKAGVILDGLVPATQVQLNLFGGPDFEKSKDQMSALDEINRRMGRDALKIASVGKEQNWKMRCEMRSPRYTTRWDELAAVG